MKEKSYTELMKASAMKRKRKKEAFVLDLYVDMVISDAILNRKLQAVKVKLDEALDCKNKKMFITLSNEYIQLQKEYGS
ncbi:MULTISPECIES: IDEAL domain-containing protein [Cytobacillus]|uniref:IDEAL domain-containing protein n=1 Tax=Cytobacillus TaxID=2675230 RepID=UPI001CD37406|nr:IDEAL domain-containing protein [Cytobacillus kochii]MCA1027410.1 IDEAL domain-containing protein [Cytobacillus kochii]MDM5206919.1 IDEAL domain-containing protein [Cytobacillus kochii]